MRYRFGSFDLDGDRFELRDGDVPVPAEPQVLALLMLLIANRDRLVTKDEVVERVWHGRIVSDSAISSRVKSARRLIGDDGDAQRWIRTVHGRGFRFVGEVTDLASAEAAEAVALEPERPSIAVLPLAPVGELGAHAIVAEALPHEIIRELSRMRWLFVIARGSAFRFGGASPDIRRIGAVLGVRYLLSGTIAEQGGRLIVEVELAATCSAGIVWAERYEVAADAVRELRDEVVAGVVSALEVRIPLHEADRARLAEPERLGAWSAYHLGLQHMFRFTAIDNHTAGALFSRAVAAEPGFARAHAGLSFTAFQDAFLNYADAAPAASRARDAAERAVALDPFDPFVNAAMGRAHWLDGDLEASIAWLDRSVALSPNYAQGAYARAWAETLLCRGAEGRRHVDRAMALSPVDPLRYAMLATRALSHLVRDEADEAAAWADRAAREPGAHALIAVIAAACGAAAGDDAGARRWIDAARRKQPALTRDAFFRSFPFAEPDVRREIARNLERVGL